MFDKQNFACAALFTSFGLPLAFVPPQSACLSSREVGSLTSSNLERAAKFVPLQAPVGVPHCLALSCPSAGQHLLAAPFPGTLLFVAVSEPGAASRRPNSRRTAFPPCEGIVLYLDSRLFSCLGRNSRGFLFLFFGLFLTVFGMSLCFLFCRLEISNCIFVKIKKNTFQINY